MAVGIVKDAAAGMPSAADLAKLSRAEKLALLRRLAGEGAGAGAPAAAAGAAAGLAGVGTLDGPVRFPASFAQRRLWFLDRLEPGGAHNTIFRALRLRGRLDRTALTGALARLAVRHDALRTRFAEEDGEPYQVVEPAVAADRLVTSVDLGALGPAEREELLQSLAREEAARPFDLARAPLVRFTLVTLGPDESALLIALHHIVADGWSLGILLRELSALYRPSSESSGSAANARTAPELPALTVRYGEHARRQRERLRGEGLERELAFWRDALGEAPTVLELPTDRPRPALESFRGTIEPLAIDRQATAAVTRLAREERATPFMVLLAAFATVLGRWTGRDDLLLGTPVAGRPGSALEPLVGLFANTLVLRVDGTGDPSFRTLLRRVRAASLAAFGHQEMPFESLVEALVPERDLSRNPLFQVMFALQNMPAGAMALQGLEMAPLPVERRLSKVDLTLDLVERDGALAGYLEYNTDLFDRTTIRRLARAVERTVAAVAVRPEAPVATLDLLCPAERHALQVEWQGAAAEVAPLPVHAAFARRVWEEEAGRSGTALEVDGQTRSGRELLGAAARVSARLRAAGVGAEDRVGVLAVRSPEAIAAFLGVLGSGAAYVPLDPEYPDERLAFMAGDAEVRALLVGEGLGSRAAHVAPDGAPVVALDRLDREALFAPGPPAEETRDWNAPPERAAYVIYTSGTTGRPKGVVVPHGALANHAAAIRAAYGLGAGDRVLQFASISFDIAGEEIYPSLAAGATLVLRTDALSLEPRALVRYAAERGLTVVNIPTPLWHEWCGELERAARDRREELLPPPGLRLVVVGTEGALPERLASWRHALAAVGRSDVRWVNAYGPTEATITSVLHGATPGRTRGVQRAGAASTLGAAEQAPERVPIGRPIAGMEAYVLDARRLPVPLGAAGELCLGGAGLARGYLGQPAATAAAFVPDPAAGGGRTPGARLYRTGDLARVRPDGAIEFLGRIDDQVKIRGFRIEPGEVESALAGHPAVREVAVLALEAGPGDRRLAAYVVSAGAGGECTAEALGVWLAERLPAYMVPAAFVPLDTLPLTPSGKVDRRALPAPSWGAAGGAAGYTPPRGPVEELLAALWGEVLGIDGAAGSTGLGVGADDDFFRLGGHSLLATRVVARIRDRLGVEVPVRFLFEAPTVRGLARRVMALREEAREGGGATPAPPIVPAGGAGRTGVEAPVPASFAQQRLWFLDRLEPGSPQYLMPGRVALTVRADVLHRALAEIVARHDSLRTVFGPPAREGRGATDTQIPADPAGPTEGAPAPLGPVQVVRPAPAPSELPLPVVDLTALPAGTGRWEADRLARDEGRRPMDLATGPLFRFRLLLLEEPQLLFTMHHAVSDGWSTDLLLGELRVLSAAFAAGRPSPLAPLPVQYADYAAWQRAWLAGDVLERETAHWRTALDGMPGLLELPADRPRPPTPSGRGTRVRFALPAGAAAAVGSFARSAAATPFMVLLAAFAAVLHRHSGQQDFAVGTPVAGRDRTELESLIGFFANTLVLRTKADGDPSFGAFLGRVRETALDAYGHQDLPFEKLVEELRPERNLSHHPLFQVLFAYQDTAGAAPGTGGDGPPMRLLPSDNATARFDLVLNLWPTGDRQALGLAGSFEVAADLFDRTTVARLAGHLGVLLEGASREPEIRLSALPLLAPAERQAVVTEWNDTAAPFPEDACLHHLVAAQVERTPDAIALAAGDAALSYRAFDRRVTALAQHLHGLRVGPGTVVGVCAERSFELVVGLHAVVRAGGAYLPLDPDYPADRLAFLVEDAEVPVVLAQKELLGGALGETLRGSGAKIVALDGGRQAGPAPAGSGIGPEAEPAGRHLPAATPDDAAYVIYTSGSTGRPKGVMVPHRGIVNRLVWMQRAYGLAESDRVLQKTPFSFDVSVWELFWPLLTGARLELAAPGRHGDPAYLAGLLAERGVTTLHFVPSMLQVFLERGEAERCGFVRRVITSGEALPPSLAERLFERLPAAELHNLYGPTEASVDVSFHACRPGASRVPIGRPIENLSLHVLDPNGRPCPVGVPGELHLAGVGLARCYLRRPALTAERFVPDPFAGSLTGRGAEPGPAEAGGERLYKTGDLCRWLPDGAVEFLGRIDFQVKVRGLRIELGEIESALAEHPRVREVVVTARDGGSAGARLVAYLVPEAAGPGEEEAAPSVPELRAWIARGLPDYMIPSAFVVLDALPLSPNGKVDRRALPAPGDDRPELGRGFVAPRTPMEKDLAAIWREVLRLDRIGIEDNFFELGGHSLLATQVVTRVEERFGVELPLRAVFEAPTVAGLAERIVDLGLDGATEEDLSRLLDGIDDLSEDELAALLADEVAGETD